MDNVVDDLIRIARTCERAFEPFTSGPVFEMDDRLLNACTEVGLSWCGSNIGYHATVYTRGFRRPQPGEVFDREWGLIDDVYNRTRGEWTRAEYDTVKHAIMRRAAVTELQPIIDAAKQAAATFDAAREELPVFGTNNFEVPTWPRRRLRN
jgi:hypothetical protein